MELENKNESYQTLIRECSELVRQYGLHSCDGPVNLSPILEDPGFNITVSYEPLETGLHGYAISDPDNNIPAQIIINSFDSPEMQAETLAHEIVHLVKHAYDRMHYWWDGVADSIQETEAFHGAAILLVPLGYLLEMAREGLSSEIIGAELGVRKELVELRWRMAVEYDELKDIFDDVDVLENPKVSPGQKVSARDIEDFKGDGGEVVMLGRAILRESIKVPIGEVQSYIQPEIKGRFKDGTIYTIGGDGLAFWLSLDRDYDTEEI